MLVFSKANLVFLSVPKTGTTSYQAALGRYADMVITDPPGLKHAALYRYNRFIRPMYEKVCKLDLEVMAVMREPVSWLGSWYRYRQRPALKGHANSTAGMSFNAFVLAHLQDEPPSFANVGRQSRFLEDRTNGAVVQHLFAYENQERIQAFLGKRLNVTFSLDRLNVSPELQTELSPGVLAQLRRKHSEDFALYDRITR